MRGVGVAGADAVYANILRSVIDCHGLGQQDHRAFGGAIHRGPRTAGKAPTGGGVDDRASAGLAMMGMTWRDIRKMDFTFTAITRSQSASLSSTTEARRMIPALLNRMWIAPKSRTARSDHALAVGGAGDVGGLEDGAAATLQ